MVRACASRSIAIEVMPISVGEEGSYVYAMETPYRSSARPLPPREPDPWAEFRKWRRLGWITFFGFAPAALLVLGLSTLLFGKETTNGYFVWIGAPFMIGTMLVQMVATYQPCPCCGKTFALCALYSNPFARRCLHCKTKIGTPLKRA